MQGPALFGPQGMQGPFNGPPGPQGNQGPVGIQGPTDGPMGPQGFQGPIGVQGASGASASAGFTNPATVITADLMTFSAGDAAFFYFVTVGSIVSIAPNFPITGNPTTTLTPGQNVTFQFALPTPLPNMIQPVVVGHGTLTPTGSAAPTVFTARTVIQTGSTVFITFAPDNVAVSTATFDFNFICTYRQF